MVTPQIDTLKPGCAALGRKFISGQCSHGNVIRRPLPCMDFANCDPCFNAYIGKIKSRIDDGIFAYPAEFNFITLTLCRHTQYKPGAPCPQCETPEHLLTAPNVHSLLLAWKKLRRYLTNRDGHAPRAFRIIEVHKDGTPHLHAVMENSTELPIVQKIYDRESLASYLARQTETARLFIAQLCRYGFGPIAHVEKAYKDGRGAARYLSSYLTDPAKREWTKHAIRNLVHPSGRRIRLYDASANWSPNPGIPTFKYACEFQDTKGQGMDDTAETLCDECEHEDSNPDTNAREQLSRKRITRWLQYCKIDVQKDLTDTWRSGKINVDKFGGSWYTATTEYRRIQNALGAARHYADSLAYRYYVSRTILQDAARQVLYLEVQKDRYKAIRENLLAYVRHAGYTGPVGLLDYIIGV